jgi:hypothetical protein
MKKASVVFALTLCVIVPCSVFAKSNASNWDGTQGIESTKYAIMVHEKHMKELPRQALTAKTQAVDMGNIAVITGDQRTLISPNPFDLSGKKISFTKNAVSGYNVKVSAGTVSSTQGTAMTLGDDDSKPVTFTGGFSFPFYGTVRTSVFVNSDGNLTFDTGDNASTDRDLIRATSGPPRLCPFFADLNPSASGIISVLQTPTKVTVTWNAVPEYGGVGGNTFQVKLYKNGNIDFIFGATVGKDAITGISSGKTSVSNARLVNFSSIGPLTGVASPIFERFASSTGLDFASLLQEFHATHSQIFDFVVIFTDSGYLGGTGAFAFFSFIQNSVKGIGLPQFDESSFFGSPKVQGFLMMDRVAKYPPDPTQQFLGTNNTLEVMGQENGHRWLAFPKVMINGVKTNDLLGRDDAHWSFFFNTDASVMEGNQIRDNGNGTFTTVASTLRYSKLDQYIMGLIPPGAVPPSFFVQNGGDKGAAPVVGANFSGTRVNVTVQQIIQAAGPRVPPSTTSQKAFREAFIYFIKPGTGGPNPSQLAQVEKIRAMWQPFFSNATNHKGSLDTTLPH